MYLGDALQWLEHTSTSDFQCSRRNSSSDLLSLFPVIRLNVDRLSHVASSDGLVSSDEPKAQLVTLGHSPHKYHPRTKPEDEHLAISKLFSIEY